MDYLTAVHTATARIRTRRDDETEDQACLMLAGQAGVRLAGRDPVWSLLGLDLLTVLSDLYPQRAPNVLTADEPTADSPALRAGVADLVTAVADRYDETSADPDVDTMRQFALAAAAAYLREAARQLR